jgi:hypothetical protein
MAIVEINPGRWTADIAGDFVVFLLGAEVRDPEQAGPALGLLMAMVDMLAELVQDPTKGLLGFQQFGDIGGVIVQYWRSFEALEAYAKNPSAKHAPVWREWNRLATAERSSLGIWHEAIYENMPVMGLQKAGKPVTISEARASARQRLGT